MSYKAIGFDYTGVIFGLPGSLFFEKLGEAIGVPAETIGRWYFANDNRKVNVGGVSWREYWGEILTAQGMADRLEVLLSAQRDWQESQRVNQNMVDLMKQLKSGGYKIGILSNNRRNLRSKIAEHDFDTLADAVCISEELGLMKPDPKVFEIFIRDLGVQPEELIYIDDTQRSLETSDEVGYTPILFRSYEQLIEELGKLGITLK